MITLWGRADHKEQYDDGFYWVSTPSHGGFLLSRKFAKRNLTPEGYHRGRPFVSFLAYEEDCDWAIVVWELHERYPQLLTTAETKEQAFKTLSLWHADYLIARQIAPDPVLHARHLEMKQDDAMRKAKHPNLIIAARGDWHTKRPGVVEVVTADDRVHYVTAESYDSREGLNLLSKCQLVA